MRLRTGDMFGPASDPFDPASPGSGSDREIVVWVDEEKDLMALFHASRGVWPRLDRLSHVVERILGERMILESAARLDPTWLNRPLNQEDRDERDARMSVIKPLITACPEIFDPIERGRLIGAAHRSSGRARNSIKAWLKSYYRNGRCANALLSKYEACGHRRKGVIEDHWKKLGPKSGKTGKKSENASTSIRLEFLAATKRERAFAGDTFKIKGAYKRWQDEFCHVMVEVDGKLTAQRHPRYENAKFATYQQFHRWYESTGQHKDTSRQVLGDSIYEKDNRAIRSTSTAETWAVGARFQIDATVVNFGVTSQLKPNVLLGRPYLYFVRDVYSRMIVGYYLGFQPPSELTAALALMSAFTSKDEVLRSFGFEPAVDRWPSNHVPGALLHDGGELTGHWGDWLVGKLSVGFEQASAERGDLKGAVETLFHWSDVEWSRTTAGHVQAPRYRARGKRQDDFDLAAAGKLDTVWEFERKVVEFILNWNNLHVFDGYDADPDMVAAGVARIPIDMFEWGIANRGTPRVFDDDYVRFRMMPRARASVYAQGLKFQDIFFTSPELLPLQAEAARTGRVRKVDISHDLTGKRVLWHSSDSPLGYFVCGRADSHRWVEDLRIEDVAALTDERAEREKSRKLEEERQRAERAAQRHKDAAERTPSKAASKETRAQLKAASSQARREARDTERNTVFEKNSPAGAMRSPLPASANILPFSKPPKGSYAPPSLEEFENDDSE